MDFSAFDTSKINAYSKQAKEQWGNTAAYKEYEEKAKQRTNDEDGVIANEFMQLFGEFTDNIDGVGGVGTAEFTDKAIQIYCEK